MTNSDPHPITSGTPRFRVKGDFYPLQKVELIALRQAKLINNTAFVYLAVRYEHPYSDRPIRIRTKEFSIEWGIPESSLYEAIATLKREKVIKIHTRELVIEWNSQQEGYSGNPESILGSHSPFRDPGEHSGSPEKSASKSRSLKGSRPRSSQTFKTFKSLETERCVENNEQGGTEMEQGMEDRQQETGRHIDDMETRGTFTLSPPYPLTPSSLTQPSKLSPQNSQLPPLLQQAKALKVNLNDARLKTAITTFPERVPTALAALTEKPEGTVRSPTRFLETAIRENWQPETNLNPEFNHWYRKAQSQGCPIIGAELKDGVQWVIASNGQHFPWKNLRSLTWEQLHQQLNAPPPLDLSNTLAALDCEIDRLGWSLEQIRKFLQKTYNKPHRELLTDEELTGFLKLLEAQT
ncbi:hypothetical protein K9N68_05760 [Kovacikia minuta CCNUW1]|uniref:hypothetical protein n=1 Tax=Kovacikia minuta TaxID=2931930 RepID=UPI001CCD72DD|nr:hypothetical protein [Kovacikia minuta]UBF27451.1 hypothetical protein K9N68_05760 [Kovacikia minuta CCNUW1]